MLKFSLCCSLTETLKRNMAVLLCFLNSTVHLKWPTLIIRMCLHLSNTSCLQGGEERPSSLLLPDVLPTTLTNTHSSIAKSQQVYATVDLKYLINSRNYQNKYRLSLCSLNKDKVTSKSTATGCHATCYSIMAEISCAWIFCALSLSLLDVVIL